MGYAEQYPEMLSNNSGRPLTCLRIDTPHGFSICVPYRSSIRHNNAFLFSRSDRSKTTGSGLDYSKAVIVRDDTYLDPADPAVVDQDEYEETSLNLSSIVSETVRYVTRYMDHMNGRAELHPCEFERRYRFSSLPYFHDVLGIKEISSPALADHRDDRLG